MDLPVGKARRAPCWGVLHGPCRRNGFAYELKWDGFRCIAFRDGEEIDLRSGHGRPLARYFPELVEVMAGIGEERFASTARSWE